MPAELISLHQDGPQFQPPTMPTQGSSSSSSNSRSQGKRVIEDEGGRPTPTDNLTTQQADTKLFVSHEQKKFIKRYRTEVAASASSVLSTLATFPLDSVKTRMQTYKYSGFVDCVRHTYQTEQLRGFFRGRFLLSSLGRDISQNRRDLSPFNYKPHPPPTIHNFQWLTASNLVFRRDCPLGKHYHCPNCFFFDLPTIKIRLLGLVEEKLWYRCSRPCQQERDVSESFFGCLFRCGGCYSWFMYYTDRM